MTLAYKCEHNGVIIEAPLCREKNFMVLLCTMLLENGQTVFSRKLFETVGGRKHKLLLFQRFRVKKPRNNIIKPIFYPLPKDYLAHKRAKIVKYINLE